MDLLICNAIAAYIHCNTTTKIFQCSSRTLWSKGSNQRVPALLVDRRLDGILRPCKCYERFTRIWKGLLVYPLVRSASRLVHIYEDAYCLNKSSKSVAIRLTILSDKLILSVALHCGMHNSQKLWKVQAYWTVHAKCSSNWFSLCSSQLNFRFDEIINWIVTFAISTFDEDHPKALQYIWQKRDDTNFWQRISSSFRVSNKKMK